MSSGASSSSSPRPAEAGDGYWAAREEAASRLEAMAAKALGEDDLSAEQLETNNQLQEDEVLALQAIYGDDMVILEDKAGLRSFQIFVRYPIPNGTKLKALATFGANMFAAAVISQYICVNCYLLLTIASDDIVVIDLQLLALQAIYGDDMVIFDNMDGLRFFQISLHYQLQGDIQVYMNVCTDGTTETVDEDDDEDANDGLLYACSLRHLPPITLTCLLPRSYPSTHAPYFVIAVKWLDEPEVSRNFIQLPCNHSFCVKCMESYCSIHVKEGSVTTLARPDTSCRAPLPPPVLRRLLDKEGYARWESLVLRRTLDTMPDVAYYPRCNAACVAAGDDAQCPACFFTFCAQCGERRHVGYASVPAEDKLDDLLERQKLMRASAREQRSEAQRLREQRKVEDC
ncbi:hypothetical protein BAE44_0014030 [Dichanthelium oligosanthes]|uniref:RBR-type E3 ubiquitin transferase n=1 Tax=Dichanthelium oligosanthes TaxID=888268 RepID=A0A1E5VIN3_9POAL|nr:hypothetical protein BAE44_0014030 [Dichanthelium oligosanthes]